MATRDEADSGSICRSKCDDASFSIIAPPALLLRNSSVTVFDGRVNIGLSKSLSPSTSNADVVVTWRND